MGVRGFRDRQVSRQVSRQTDRNRKRPRLCYTANIARAEQRSVWGWVGVGGSESNKEADR